MYLGTIPSDYHYEILHGLKSTESVFEDIRRVCGCHDNSDYQIEFFSLGLSQIGFWNRLDISTFEALMQTLYESRTKESFVLGLPETLRMFYNEFIKEKESVY